MILMEFERNSALNQISSSFLTILFDFPNCICKTLAFCFGNLGNQQKSAKLSKTAILAEFVRNSAENAKSGLQWNATSTKIFNFDDLDGFSNFHKQNASVLLRKSGKSIKIIKFRQNL